MAPKNQPIVVTGRHWSYVDGKRIDHPPIKWFVHEPKAGAKGRQKPDSKKRRKSA